MTAATSRVIPRDLLQDLIVLADPDRQGIGNPATARAVLDRARALLVDPERSPMVPTVHLNGTSREMLVDQLSDAAQAVHAAGRELALATPNGRDFYPQGPAAIGRALAEHNDRMLRLQSVARELEEIAQAVDVRP
jgi:hypothetical protein